MKIIRSGKRNTASTSIGSITSLRDPVDRSNPSEWELKIDSSIGVIATGAGVFKDFWKVDNRYVSEIICDTVTKLDSSIFNASDGAMLRYEKRNDSRDPILDQMYFNPTSITASYEYLHFSQNRHTSDCRTNGRNCLGSANSHFYITRGLLKFNLSSIPSNASIESANLFLYRKTPKGLWPHCDYWNNVTVAHDYAPSYNADYDNAAYLRRITGPWGINTKRDQLNSITSSANQVSMAAVASSCASYNVSCTDLIKDYISNPSYGLVIMEANESENGCNTDQIRHLSFCWPDVSVASRSSFIRPPATNTCDTCSVGPSLKVKYNYISTSCKDTCVSVFDRRINPYVQGIYGNWRLEKSYTFFDSRKDSVPDAATDIRRNGEFRKFMPFWILGSPLLTQTDYIRWVWNSEITQFNKRGLETENKDPLGRYNSGLYGYNQTLPVAVAQNAKYRQIAFEGFEDYFFKNDSCDQRCPPARHLDFSFYKNKIDTAEKHTGKSSLKLLEDETDSLMIDVVSFSNDSTPGILTADTTGGEGCNRLDSIITNYNMITPVFSPIQGDSMILSAWVKEALDTCRCGAYLNNEIQILYYGSGGYISTATLKPSGGIIEGWQRYEEMIKIPSSATSMKLKLKNTGADSLYFDDIRLHPFNSNLKSFVYHPINLRLMAELDENNYASFYEYDDEGTLVRVKKETERGIKTIQETRSVLLKQ